MDLQKRLFEKECGIAKHAHEEFEKLGEILDKIPIWELSEWRRIYTQMQYHHEIGGRALTEAKKLL